MGGDIFKIKIPNNKQTINSNDIGPEKLVYKFPFFNFLFKEKMIADWPFTKRILVTAFDLYKSDSFITQLSREGRTLREYLHDQMGLNKDIAIFADTGIFELEARKARVDLGFAWENEILPELSTEDIFTAYEIIKPDFLVAPDEIILYNDSRSVVESKLEIIKQNLQLTLDRFPKSKIFATIQGIDHHDIEELLDFTKEQGIRKIARGGILPLRKHSKSKYYEVLQVTEQLARSKGLDYIHAFGLSSVWSIGDYFVDNSYDSLDTSAIYWITARRQYITSNGSRIAVRKAKFDTCGCHGCNLMRRSKYYADTSGRFAIGLYFHNAKIFADIVTKVHIDPTFANKFLPYRTNNQEEDPKPQNKSKLEDNSYFELIPASQVNSSRRIEGDSCELHRRRITMATRFSETNLYQNKNILLLTGCSKKKRKFVPPQARFEDVNSLKERNEIFEKFYHLALPAREMYTGSYRNILNRSITKSQQIPLVEIDELILSAGYGIIKPQHKISPYDSTFSYKTPEQLDKMVEILDINSSLIHHLRKTPYDIIISTLSGTYHNIIQGIVIDGVSNYDHEVEMVWFTQKKGDLLDQNWMVYEIEEFFKFHKKRKPFVINPGRIWHSRANIFHSYINYLFSKCNRNSTYVPHFFDFWHNLFDCNCTISGMSN